MKQATKMAGLVLAAATVAVAGCAKTTEPAPTNTTPAGTEAPKSKVPEKHYTIKIHTPPGSGIPKAEEEKAVEEEVNKYLKDKINASIDLNFLDWGPWFEKIPVMIASGEKMDIMFTAGWSSYTGNAQKGAYLPLDELIAKHAPKTKALLDPVLFEGAKYKGKVYGIPANKEIAEQKGFAFRKDLVEKYNMDVSKVKKIEDVEPFLEIIKKNEKEIIPYGIMNANGPHQAKIIEGGDIGYKDGKFISSFEVPEWTKDFHLARKWFQAGYINQDAATAQDMDARVKAGKVFAMESGLKPGKAAEMKQGNGFDWVLVPFGNPMITNDSVRGSMMAISRTSEDPERAMMFLELLNTDPYLNNLINFGIENRHYTKVSDKVIKEIPKSGYKPNAGWMFGNQFINYLWDNEDLKKWDQFKEFNKQAVPSQILGFDYNSEPVKAVKAGIDNIVKEYITGLATGALDPTENLPKLNQRLKDAGIDKVVAEKNKQLEEWKKENKK